MRIKPVLVLVALGLALLASACGSHRAPFRIAVITDCGGGFAPFRELTVAGGELPFVRRGAKLLGTKPSAGVSPISIAGRKVELLQGCETYGSQNLLVVARQLVERDGANAVVWLYYGDGTKLREYAKRRPDVLFSAGSVEPGITLRDPLPNLFRFNLDAAQWSAGLGTYAFRDLGWRTAVTVGEDDEFGYPQVAGFVAEFCALGGTIVKRLWAPAAQADFSRLVRTIPASADGAFFPGGVQAVNAFVEAYAKLHPDLAQRLVGGGVVPANVTSLAPLGAHVVGVVGGWPYPFEPTAAYRDYLAEFRRMFPHLQGGGPFDINVGNAVEAVLEALEQVHGDSSNGQAKLRRALTTLVLRTPTGTIRLDRNRQAIGTNVISEIERGTGGKLDVRTLRVVPHVEQTFGGYFSSTTASPSRTAPACVRRRPPAWAR